MLSPETNLSEKRILKTKTRQINPSPASAMLPALFPKVMVPRNSGPV